MVGQGYCNYTLYVAKLYSESLIEGGSVISLKTSQGGKNVVGQDSQGSCRLATKGNAPFVMYIRGAIIVHCAVTVNKEPMMQRQIVVVIGRQSGSHSSGNVIRV